MRMPAPHWFLVALLLLSGPSSGAGEPGAEPPGVAERAYIASEIYAALPLYFAHWEGTPDDLDLQAAYKDYLAEALAATDRRGFSLATMRFMARLRNGHTRFWDDRLYHELGQPLGFTARPLEGSWVVTASQVDGLRPGDLITHLEGEPVDDFVGRLLPLVAASSEPAARALLFHPQRQEHLFPSRFTLGLDDGRSVLVDRSLTGKAPALPGTEARVLEGGRVGYVRIPSFGAPAFEEAAVAFIQANPTLRALVIDVRGNGGGNTPMTLIHALMDRPYRGFTESTPMSPALLRQHFRDAQFHWKGDVTQPQADPYRGRIILLTDALCASACEDLLVPFRDSGRASIVGETTQGTTGQPHFRQLGDGMSFMVGMKRVYFPDGSPFEGVGVRPDIEVQPTRDDLRRGRDRALERSIKLAAGPAAD